MSHPRRRASRRRPGTKDRARLRSNQPARIHSVSQAQGTAFATLVGFGMTVVLVLGITLVVILGHGGNAVRASGNGPAPGIPVGYGSLNHPKGTCGNTGQAQCPAADPGWFPVASGSSDAVATAISSGRDFVSMKSRFGYVSLDTPVLVQAYRAHTGWDYYDDAHWVVSVRDATGIRCGIFDFVYDSVHQRMRFSSYGVLTPQDPHSGQAFPYLSQTVAVAHLQSQRGLSVMVGSSPELTFFPIDPRFPYLSSPVHKWVGGGNSAMNPMWHIVGSDGHDYFVGADLNVHTRADLPIAAGQP